MEQTLLLFFSLMLLYVCIREIKSKLIVVALWLTFFGIAGNQIVVSINGGRMPVFFTNNLYLPEDGSTGSLRHQIGDEYTKLKILADTIYVKPIERIVSIGDILIFVAAGVPVLWCIIRIRKRRVGFFKKTIPISYPVAFSAMVTSLLVLILKYNA